MKNAIAMENGKVFTKVFMTMVQFGAKEFLKQEKNKEILKFIISGENL